MNYIDINDFENLILAKDKVISCLLEKKVISENMNFEQFITYLDVSKYVFMKENQVIAFNIVNNINDESYLFYTGENSLIKQFKSILKNINYDLSKLKKPSIERMLSNDFIKNPKFIINNNYYVI